MYNNGVSISDIVAKEGVTKHAIFGIVRRYRHQESAKENSRSGRPLIVTDRDKSHILRIIDSDPFISCRVIIERAGLCCYKSTLTRWLKKQGVQHYLSLRRPFLGPTTVQKRLTLARRYVNEDSTFWYNWIISDKVSIARGDGVKTKWVFCKYVSQASLPSYHDSNRKKGERLKRRFVQPLNPPTKHSKLFFGAFSFDRSTELGPS